VGRVIAVANQKGGVGKTTTAVNLSACLAAKGRRVLLLDLDPQANATGALGVSAPEDGMDLYSVVVEEKPVSGALHDTGVQGLTMVPAGQNLIGAEIELAPVIARESRLRSALAGIRSDYDFILIDCPPSLGLLTINALTAADRVPIPIQCEFYALEGLGRLISTIRLIQRSLNDRLAVEGVLLTMYDGRLNLSQQVAEEARGYLGSLVYETVIPRSVRLSEAPGFGKPIILYDPSSTGAASYLKLAEEVIARDTQGAGTRDQGAHSGSGAGGDAGSDDHSPGRGDQERQAPAEAALRSGPTGGVGGVDSPEGTPSACPGAEGP
jgi:chromosome partitioning protein